LSKIINTQYYLQHLLHRVSLHSKEIRKNNYIGFVQHLNDFLISKNNEKAIITTFNYDTILENALKHGLNYTFLNEDNYIDYKNRNLLLFKPHGSWNWVKDINEGVFQELDQTANYYFDNNPNFHKFLYDKQGYLSTLNKYTSNDRIRIIDLIEGSKPYLPQLLIPFSDKDEFIMPNSHLFCLKYMLKDIKLIIAVGWKGSEKYFKTLLSKNILSEDIHILYVTLKDNTIESELREVFPKGIFSNFAPEKNSKGTFTEFVSFLTNYGDEIFERAYTK